MIGFDFNGVVDTGNKRPSIDTVIITGNTYVAGVLDYLNTHGIKCAVYFPPDKRMSNNHNAVAVWKSEMIRRLGLTEFYESNKQEWEILRDSCPDCKVFKV